MANKTGSRGFSRALRILATFGALAVVAGFPGAAHAKKQHKLKMDPDVPSTAAPAGPVPPEADANGHVNYGNPQAEGLGRVTVKSKTGDKVQVYLEGRYFGDAPITIYSVPKGDYIVEGTIVGSGKQVSSPVSVSENEEATVELGAGKPDAPVAEAGGGSGGFLGGEISPSRMRLVKIGLGVTALGLVGTVLFAVLENGKEKDYESTPAPQQARLDSLASDGRRYATLTDVSLFVMGAGVVGTVIAALPMFTHAEKPAEAPGPTAFFAPIVGHGTTGGSLSLRF